MTVGEKIYHLRREKGISQKDLAAALKVSRQSVSKWENDLMPVSYGKQEELKKFLCADSLFAEEEVAISRSEKVRFTANQKIVIAIISVFIALSVAVTVIVGIVSIPNLWADETQVTSLYVDFGYFWLAVGITLFIIAIEIFTVIVYRKENRKKLFGKN